MMKRPLLGVAVLVALAGAIIYFGQVYAQKPTPSDDQVNAVARQLYCPVCENIPLDVCPTTACSRWRDLIRSKLADGWNTQQIKDYFAAQYGDRVLSVPPRRGLNWALYVLPPVLILGGAAAVYLVLRRMRQKSSPVSVSPTPPPDQDDEYLRRVEEELNQRGSD